MNTEGIAASQLFPSAAAPVGEAGRGDEEVMPGGLFLELLAELLADGAQGVANEAEAITLPPEDARDRGKEEETLTGEAAALGMMLPQSINLEPLPVLCQQNLSCSWGQESEGATSAAPAAPFPGESQAAAAPLPEAVAPKGFPELAAEIAELSEEEKPHARPEQQLPPQPPSQEKADISPKGLFPAEVPQQPGRESREAADSVKEWLNPSEEKASAEAAAEQQRPGSRAEPLGQRSAQPAQTQLKHSEGLPEGSIALQSEQRSAAAGTLPPPLLNRDQVEAAYTRQVIEQIVEQAHLAVGKNGASLKLHLKPEFLGELKLTISVNNGALHAHFTADNALVANMIEARLPELRQALAEHGASWQQVSVSVATQSSAGSFASHYQDSGSGYQHTHTHAYAMRDEPYAQDDFSGQAPRGSRRSPLSAVDYIV